MSGRDLLRRGKDFAVKHPTAALAAFVLVMLSIGTLGTEITRINIRFAMMTQEMAYRPIGCFPTINGYPYADYPVLYNLLSYWTTFGARIVNNFTMSLPTILFAVYTIVMTAKVGSDMVKLLTIRAPRVVQYDKRL